MKKLILAIIFVIALSSNFKEVQGSYGQKGNEGEVITSPGFFVDQVGRLFTMDIKDVTLEKVLAEISRRHGVIFLLPPSLAQEKVMVRFSQLELDKGLSKILRPYNHIFIYAEGNHPSHESSPSNLTEVRIFSHLQEGKVKESFLVISPAYSLSAAQNKDQVKKEDEAARKEKEQAKELVKRPLEEITRDLTSMNSNLRKKAVKDLARIEDEKVFGQLALAFKDKNKEVKKEAGKALKEMGELLKVQYKEKEPLDGEKDDSQTDAKEEKGETSSLTLEAGSGDASHLELDNLSSVRGVQFKIKGAKPVEVRTTSRTEGFFAQFNKDNGTVILLSIAGNEIAPGKGPIAEIVCSGAGSASLSEVKIVE